MSNAYSERHLRMIRMTRELETLREDLERLSRERKIPSPDELAKERRYEDRDLNAGSPRIQAEFYFQQGELSMLARLRELLSLPPVHHECQGPRGEGCLAESDRPAMVARPRSLCALCGKAEQEDDSKALEAREVAE